MASIYHPQPSKKELQMMLYGSVVRFGIFCALLRAAPYVSEEPSRKSLYGFEREVDS